MEISHLFGDIPLGSKELKISMKNRAGNLLQYLPTVPGYSHVYLSLMLDMQNWLESSD